ncbi:MULTISPECIES: hypothetical protein [unclassified Streptomyces]|uniref:hypothetical protein n=1 Tax=unclassified Streptomyces TaxID=2593676 RepID=UPI002365240D|nr:MULTISPECIES: hypothetical protein [unclassified Streptomyces]MDF3144360.1 hypothetical protein [Streptomyces sp. T21Q-yed]WDF41185.1 hypothetical protein PBV52_32575 [Streptomyces sp. T12]
MSQDDVDGVPGATALLGRALQGVPMPSGPGSDAVFARAARVRWRRRGVVTGVAAAVAAVSLTVTGVLPGNGREQAGSAGTQTTSGADRLAKLLPPGIGEIREVEPVVGEGPYDGFYAVYKDGGVGYLTFQVLPGRREDWPVPVGERCSSYLPGMSATCVPETLPNGDERESTELARESRRDGRTWGPFRSVRLFTKGYVVMIKASSGFDGKQALGPRLDAPPLTAEQLREVVMAPELLP